MGSVIADGEEVVFDEGTPDLRDIFDLVSQALGDQRKAIVKFEVDQRDCLQMESFLFLQIDLWRPCFMMK